MNQWTTNKRLKVHIVGISGDGPVDLEENIATFEGGGNFRTLVVENRPNAETWKKNNIYIYTHVFILIKID